MSLLVAKGIELTTRVANQDVTALRDVSFELRSGEILGIIGESGAGKTMIGRLIARQLPAGFNLTAGMLSFEGRNLLTLSKAEHRALLGRRISVIPQDPMGSLNPVLSIGNQFTELLKRLGLHSARVRRVTAAEHLAAVHLPRPREMLDRFPHQLSGGQCQRVLIAMAFAGDPALIIADEPTTALDVVTQAIIIELLAEMRAIHGTAVMLITHDLRLAAHVCNNMLVLYAGEAVEYGPAREIFESPAHPYTRSLNLANPTLAGRRRPLVNLPEHMPGLVAIASMRGCRFALRCPAADPGCADNRQSMREVGPKHWVRCSDVCVRSRLMPSGAEFDEGSSSTPKAPVLTVKDLGKIYKGALGLLGRSPPVHALKDVTFELCAGEFVGIVGESGSGKSTLAKLLLGLEAPSAGRILLDGTDITVQDAAARRRRIESLQMIFQDPQSALNPRRMVASLVTQSMEVSQARSAWPKRLERAKLLLQETGLPPEFATRFPAQLSGGQRQRVNIARALCPEPRIIVADEIVSGLDVLVQAQILNLLLRLRHRRDIAVLFISHDLSVVRYLCSRVLVMHRGEIVESGATEEVFARPQHPYTRKLLAAVPPDSIDTPWPPRSLARADRVCGPVPAME